MDEVGGSIVVKKCVGCSCLDDTSRICSRIIQVKAWRTRREIVRRGACCERDGANGRQRKTDDIFEQCDDDRDRVE